MQDYFEALADHLGTLLRGDEVYLANFDGEESDFVRLNRSAVRQAGQVAQRTLRVEFIDGDRHVSLSLGLCGRLDEDRTALAAAVPKLRECLPHVSDDPYLLFNEQVDNTHFNGTNALPPAHDMLDVVLAQSQGVDLVGFLATGGLHRGFASSLGQRNWHTTYSANFDWSMYLGADRAVKAAYAGQQWHDDEVVAAMTRARTELALLQRPALTLAPGAYRAYLAPSALVEVMELLAWGGFGLKSLRTRQSPLQRLGDAQETLHPSVHLAEDNADGIAPAFQGAGFIRPDVVPLVEAGRLREPLVSPRSAREYGEPTNGANDAESPQSLVMRGGALEPDRVLEALGTGLYINNLWYLNFSDRPACRMTGMTRYAAFWVERGEIVAPVNVMRFDDSLYRLLGENLLALTSQPQLMLSTDTYEARSTHSMRLPGALVEDLRLTL